MIEFDLYTQATLADFLWNIDSSPRVEIITSCLEWDHPHVAAEFFETIRDAFPPALKAGLESFSTNMLSSNAIHPWESCRWLLSYPHLRLVDLLDY